MSVSTSVAVSGLNRMTHMVVVVTSLPYPSPLISTECQTEAGAFQDCLWFFCLAIHLCPPMEDHCYSFSDQKIHVNRFIQNEWLAAVDGLGGTE